MKIWEYFRRRSLQKQRRIELEFNRKMAELNRQAISMKRQSDHLKAEAIRHEQNGDHKSAVAAAAAAVHQEKSYISAMNTMQTCRNMHAQVKSQKALKELIGACAEMARSVSRDAAMEDMIVVQNEFAQTMEELEQTRDALEAVQEGFTADTEAEVRNEAGERALAQIMGQLAPANEPAALEAPMPMTVADEAEAAEQQKEWADERRRILADLAEPVG